MANDSQFAVLVPLSIIMAFATLNGFILEASAVGECGRTPIRSAFARLSPVCLGAARDAQAKVSPVCCAKVSLVIGMGTRCLCAVLLSPVAKEVRIIPAAAISIPKRCHMRKARSECRAAKNTVPSATKAKISPFPEQGGLLPAPAARSKGVGRGRRRQGGDARMMTTLFCLFELICTLLILPFAG